MGYVECPHCSHRVVVTSRVPKEVVVVLPCPSCHDLVVLFRGKVAGLKRDVLESGDFEAKKDHIAEIIAQFLDPESVDLLGGIGSYGGDAEDNLTETGEDFLQDTEAEEEEAPISQEEMEHFVSFDLQRIDEAAYFHRHFGD